MGFTNTRAAIHKYVHLRILPTRLPNTTFDKSDILSKRNKMVPGEFQIWKSFLHLISPGKNSMQPISFRHKMASEYGSSVLELRLNINSTYIWTE
jgi:hypothetical protein